MLKTESIQDIIDQLMFQGTTHFFMNNFHIRLDLADNGQQLHLSAPVFTGNFIPLSIRKILKNKNHLKVDDSHGEIHFHQQTFWDIENIPHVKEIIFEFIFQAEEVRRFLDERGREDLLPIYLKK